MNAPWKMVLLAAWLVGASSLVAIAGAAEFHVSPDGRTDGDGSRQRPWDLATALAQPRAVQPGDVIWLHGGTYRGTFVSRLAGTAERPIVVRQAPGERATLDAAMSGQSGTTLDVRGEHTWFQGFEVTNSSPRRTTETTGSHPADLGLNGSIDVYAGRGHKLINLVVHHCAGGPSAWSGAFETEAYGCIVFNNGWDAPDRGHGHAFYWQNREGTKRIVDCIFFNQFSHGVHCYGSSRATLDHFHLEGNIAFHNGVLSKRSGPARNVLVGGGRVAENVAAVDNFSYYATGGSNILGYGRGAKGLTVRGNYFAAPEGTALEVSGENVTIEGNTFIGRIGGFDLQSHADNTHVAARRDEPLDGLAVRIAVRPNRYEPGRANVVIFNWPRKEVVEIDLTPAGLKQGQRYEIRDVQDWFGEPVLRGQYDGQPVATRMTGRKAAPPVGDAPIAPPHTGPTFAALVVLPQAD